MNKEIKAALYIAFAAGEMSGRGKAYTEELMKCVSRGSIATLKNFDANHAITSLSFIIGDSRDPQEIINDLFEKADSFYKKAIELASERQEVQQLQLL